MGRAVFVYRDSHGHMYSPHGSMLAQPGLTPGNLDLDTREFTPTGNPLKVIGTVITDGDKVISGMTEDKGANMAPLGAGVAFTLPSDESNEDLKAQISDIGMKLEEEIQHTAMLEAQIEFYKGMATKDSDAETLAIESGIEVSPDPEESITEKPVSKRVTKKAK